MIHCQRENPTWHSYPPQRRLWALVLDNIPCVAQYEPKFAIWTSRDGRTYSNKVLWHELPYHPLFNCKTHVVKPPCEVEDTEDDS